MLVLVYVDIWRLVDVELWIFILIYTIYCLSCSTRAWGPIFVYEGDTGEIKSISDNKISVIANLSAGSPATSPLQPPSMVFNGIVAHKGNIFATDEMKRSIYKISP